MKDQKIIYQGGAAIYLQGLNALEVASSANKHSHMSFFVGSPESAIQVNDYRESSRSAAQKALSGQDIFGFADIFNQPAWIEINEDPETTEIEIRDGEGMGNNTLLWLGVIDDGEMSVQEIIWENLRALDDDRIAFVALVVKN
jgi:hypothetical protein